jgi:flagellin-like protein
MWSADRAVSPVVGVALLLVIVVLLTALVGTMVSGVDGESAPTVRPDYDGTITADRSGDDDQRVVLAHGGGPELDVTDLRIVVRVPAHERSTTVEELPVGPDGLDSDEFVGHDLLDNRREYWRGPVVDPDGTWGVGERIAFRLKHGAEGVRLAPGDRVRVLVVHRRADVIVMDATYEAV